MKKIIRKISFVCLALLMMSTQCRKDMDCRTKLVNDTNEVLWFDFDCSNFPDSLLYCLEGEVAAHSTRELCTNQSWEDRFVSYRSNVVKVYITNLDTAKKYNMLQLIEGKKYYKKLILSKEDLERMNWIIKYP